MKQPPKKWLWRLAKLAIVALVLGAVWHTFQHDRSRLSDYHWHVRVGWLGLSAGLYILGILPAAWFWHYVLNALGQEAGLAEAIRAYYIGHLGKYVPGKALVVVLRAGLVRSHRVSASLAAVSVFFETFTMMAVGGFISAAILASWFREHQVLFWGSLGAMVCSGLPTFPPVFKWAVRITGVGGSDATTLEKIDKLGAGALLVGWGAMTVGWVLLALSYWAVLMGMGVEGTRPLADLPRYTAGVCLAVVAGFLSFIPGGFFAREAVLKEMMEPYFRLVAAPLDPSAAATISAVLLRLVWLVSELAVSVILYLAGRRALGSQSVTVGEDLRPLDSASAHPSPAPRP